VAEVEVLCLTLLLEQAVQVAAVLVVQMFQVLLPHQQEKALMAQLTQAAAVAAAQAVAVTEE
tara:strand:+ start:328 stop:513 length:186 start_codon:yes stop_codon:yes gene_type:complete